MEQLYVKIIPTCWMILKKMFLYHCCESDDLTCGEDLSFVERAELKGVIFSNSVVVSHFYYVLNSPLRMKDLLFQYYLNMNKSMIPEKFQFLMYLFCL